MTWAPLAQMGGAVPTSAWDLLLSTDPVTKAVLGVLAVLSRVSWTIVLAKWREFGRVTRASRIFMDGFDKAKGLSDVAALARKGGASPFAHVLDRAERFMSDTRPAMAATTDRTARFSASQLEALRLVLDSQAESERDTLAHYVPWLATIGSASPKCGTRWPSMVERSTRTCERRHSTAWLVSQSSAKVRKVAPSSARAGG